MPISKKSNTPCILKPFHPSSLLIVLLGASSKIQTNDISSSVFPTKQYSLSKLMFEVSLT